jgi:hypothetical protein
MMSMITPGTLLLNKNDMITWWLLVGYSVVEDCICNVAWLNITNSEIINIRTHVDCLNRAALCELYMFIEP